MKIKIGEWIEKESRDVTQCPSYYAADTETLRTKPGRYPLFVTIEGGYTCPMPQWILTSIDADRIAGQLYSGFGGNNFASTELRKEPKPVTPQMYAYQLGELVASGRAELAAEFTELATDYLKWARAQTWEGLKALTVGV